MVKNNFNKISHFPYTYGDNPVDDNVRLSFFVSKLMQNKKFQNYAIAVFVSVLALGSYAVPSSAIPPEYGEAANNMVGQVQQDVPPISDGKIINNIGQPDRVNLNSALKNPGLPKGQEIPQSCPKSIGPEPTPGNPPVFLPILPPTAVCERIVHSKPWSIGGVLAIGWVCFTTYVTKDRGLAGICAGLFFYAVSKK